MGMDPNAVGADPTGRGNELVRLRLPGNMGTIMPEEVAAHLIQYMVSFAEAYLGRRVKRAVMGVPVRFGRYQRYAMERAANLIGIESVKLETEPDLAVRAYAYKVNPQAKEKFMGAFEEDIDPHLQRRNILVADLGGGTFDVTLVRNELLTENRKPVDEMHMLGTAGDARLGGDDFDNDLLEWAMESLSDRLQNHRENIWPLSKANKSRLKLVLRKAKEQLSSKDVADVEFAGARLQLTRGEFNSITAATLERMLSPISEACADTGVKIPFESLAVKAYEHKVKQERKRRRPAGSKQAGNRSSETLASRLRNKRREGQQLKSSDVRLSNMANKLGVTDLDATEEDEVVHGVLCVGAATWTPAVQELLELMTGCKPSVALINPETAVVYGAAVLASMMDSRAVDIKVVSSLKGAWEQFLVNRPELVDRMKKTG